MPTIAYAVLASLAHEPHSGYELSQLMGPPRNYMWEAKHSQVYPTLSLLTQAGYVVYTDVEQESRPDKKVYHVTPAGRVALRIWALTGPTHVPVRDEFSLRLSALCTLTVSEACSMLEQQIEFVSAEITAIDAHLKDFSQRFELPDTLTADHNEYGLVNAIQLSRDLKAASIARYQAMHEELRKAGNVSTRQREGGTLRSTAR